MRLTFYVFLLFSIVFGEKLAAQVSFEAKLDTRQAVVGSSVELSFSLKNASGKNFRPPVIDGFRVRSGPNISNSMTMINGAVTRGTTWSYLLQPLTEGHFEIGPATVLADGKTMKTAPLALDVVKSKSQPNNDTKKNVAPGKHADDQPEVMVVAQPSAESVWLGEQVSLDYKMLTRRDLSGVEVNYEPKYNGFFAQNLERFDRSDRREIIGGKPFLAKSLKKMALFPQQTGTLKIEPMLLQAGVIEDGGGMFGGFFSQAKPTVLSTEPVEIEVKPLPMPVPPNFCGAIGNFTVVATASQFSATTDDAISIKLTLTGNGDPRRLNPPVMSWPADFEVSQSKLAEESSFENGEELVSSKTFEYILLPKTAGEFELSTEIAVFDTENGKFKTISANQNLKLKIAQGTIKPKTTAPLTEDFSQKLKHKSSDGIGSIFSSPLFWGLLGLAVLAGVGLFFLNRPKNSAVKNLQQKPAEPRIVEIRAPAKPHVNLDFATKKLAEAQAFMEKNDVPAFYRTVSEAVEFYFSEKYRLEPGQVSRSFLLTKLAAAGEDAAFLEKFERVWAACEMARFAGMAKPEAMQPVLDDARFLVAKH